MLGHAVLISFAGACAGLIQGITGMGGGMVLMLVLPYFFPVSQSAAISGAICLFLTFLMLMRYRKFINLRLAISTAVLYSLASLTAINLSVGMDSVRIQKFFGGFLILLSAFLLLRKENDSFTTLKVTSILFPLISGICDGFFGVGSPLMVLFFTAKTKTKGEYLGSIQLMFFLTLLANTVLRLNRHIIGPENIPGILFGFLGIFGGLQIANCIVGKINSEALKKMAYCAIGISGVYNLII